MDTASIDPKVRQQLTSGQPVTVTARGAGGDVIAASDVQVEPGKSATQSFQRVSGTVQERSGNRVLFKTRDGLTLPIDVSQIHGLPYIATNTPATLIYQQGSKQEIQAVWIEPGDTAASASPSTGSAASTPAPGTASPGGQTLQGIKHESSTPAEVWDVLCSLWGSEATILTNRRARARSAASRFLQ